MQKFPMEYTGPGLIDLQLNGYAGIDFNGRPDWTPAVFHNVRKAIARRGLVAVLPTFITDSADTIVARCRRYAQLVTDDTELAAFFPKLHIEGPFISPETGPRGAHPRAHCITPASAPDLLDRLIDASGNRIGILTLAPELPGAMELIHRCVQAGVVASIGHSQAGNEQIAQAVDAGASMCTHLGNGSHQMLPRLDNYVQRQLAEDRLCAGFIADGHHMPFTTLKNFLRAKTLARSFLVTDAIAAVEMGPGIHRLGQGAVEVTAAGRASRPGEENLAGSVLTLDVAILNVVSHCGVTFDDAWTMASQNAAVAVGLPTPKTVSVTVTPDGFTRV